MQNRDQNLSIPWAKPFVGGEERNALVDAFDSTWISDGRYVQQFEHQFAELLGTKFALTASNGTAALFMALSAIELKEMDEVIIPGYCFAAVANMVLAVGAKPVYVDVCPETFCLDPNLIQSMITSNTRVIIAVHTYGNMCAMNQIMDIARVNKLIVIEDAAEAIFSRYKNQYAGCVGDIGCFSFQAAKTITTGEGGMVVTNNSHWLERMNMLRNHGMQQDRRYQHSVVGNNFRLTNLQAAIGCTQLGKKDFIIKRREEISILYEKMLRNIPMVQMQSMSPNVDPVLWTHAVVCQFTEKIESRDKLIKELMNIGIELRPGFSAFHQMPIYAAPFLPVSDHLANSIICLPTHIDLSDDDIKYICNQLESMMTRNAHV